jgi:tripartite-type tricarboxylate transporter receptor subunit TctC
LGTALGQPFVPDNRPGAGSNIASAYAAKAPADGYTLLLGTAASHGMNPALYKDPGYNPNDFEGVGILSTVPMAIAVTPGSGINSLQELIAASKSRKLSVALPSNMSTVVDELLKSRAGSSMLQVPYKGSSSALADILGNHVDVIIDTVTSLRPQVRAGKLVPLALTSRTPSELMPGVKPIAEFFPDFEVTGWQVLFVPKGTPRAVVTLLNNEIKKIQAIPEVRNRILSLGFDPGTVSEPAEVAAFVKAELIKWDKLIKSANLKAD